MRGREETAAVIADGTHAARDEGDTGRLERGDKARFEGEVRRARLGLRHTDGERAGPVGGGAPAVAEHLGTFEVTRA